MKSWKMITVIFQAGVWRYCQLMLSLSFFSQKNQRFCFTSSDYFFSCKLLAFVVSTYCFQTSPNIKISELHILLCIEIGTCYQYLLEQFPRNYLQKKKNRNGLTSFSSVFQSEKVIRPCNSFFRILNL